MHISDILSRGKPTISFEFFPPKNPEQEQRLQKTVDELSQCSPDFISITYGAGGGTRAFTRDWVINLKHLNAIPHLTCVGHKQKDIDEMLLDYAAAGISNILALRGDPPKGQPGYDHTKDEFPYAANLVAHVRRFNESGRHPDPRGFGIGVAGFPEGHPATPNRLKELDYLKAKVDAGAHYICTQLFFDNHDFYDFRERCELAGITVPIIAGILPASGLAGLKRMAELTGGAHFPAKLLKRLAAAGNDGDAARKAGIEYATEQCADLIKNGVAGIHFYALNQSEAVKTILTNLNLSIHRQTVAEH